MWENVDRFLFRILKTVFNNGQSTGNTVKNWREITMKNSRLVVSGALKINLKKISLKTYLPNLVYTQDDAALEN
jgi:hypothetical protein